MPNNKTDDFTGYWYTRDHTEVVITVLTLKGKAWMGLVFIEDKKIVTLWNKEGKHYSDDKLDLMEKHHGIKGEGKTIPSLEIPNEDD